MDSTPAPRDLDGRYPTFRQVVLDCTDARLLAEFYRELLGWRYRPGDDPSPTAVVELGDARECGTLAVNSNISTAKVPHSRDPELGTGAARTRVRRGPARRSSELDEFGPVALVRHPEATASI